MYPKLAIVGRFFISISQIGIWEGFGSKVDALQRYGVYVIFQVVHSYASALKLIQTTPHLRLRPEPYVNPYRLAVHFEPKKPCNAKPYTP